MSECPWGIWSTVGVIPIRNDLPSFEITGRLQEVEGRGLDASGSQFPDRKTKKPKAAEG